RPAGCRDGPPVRKRRGGDPGDHRRHRRPGRRAGRPGRDAMSNPGGDAPLLTSPLTQPSPSHAGGTPPPAPSAPVLPPAAPPAPAQGGRPRPPAPSAPVFIGAAARARCRFPWRALLYGLGGLALLTLAAGLAGGFGYRELATVPLPRGPAVRHGEAPRLAVQ